MKKLILFGLLMSLLMVASVLATRLPHPIYGMITAEENPVMNAQIKITNTATGKSEITTTNSNGFYQVDLGNFPVGVYPSFWEGNVIKVTLLYCQGIDSCNKQVQVSGGGNELSWDIEREHITEPLPDDVIIVKYVCMDGTPVNDVKDCSVTYVCSDDSIVENREECPEETNPYRIALTIVIALIGIACVVLGKFKWGKGFVGLANYYLRLAKEAEERKDYGLAAKYAARAGKMVSTAIRKAKDGFYK